jgi:3-oxoacyl-[acyl-carrier-protein] synthase II
LLWGEGTVNGRRVVITGLGVVAPNGIGKDTFWKNLVAGKSAVDYITAFDPSPYPCQVAAEVRDFVPEDFMHHRRTKHRGRFSQFAVAAAKLALKDSGAALDQLRPERVMVCIGTSMNGIGDIYEEARIGFERNSFQGISTMSALEYAAHAPVSHVSSELSIRGQAMTLGSACATGLDAVNWGFTKIREGSADLVFTGSTDAPLADFSYAAICALGALSTFDDPPTRASRPYDLRRNGFVVGEGAAVCVLEELEHAIARNAFIYAEVLGHGSGNEGGYGPKVDSAELALADAILLALSRAGLTAADIDHISAHGNALPDYDIVETRAFKKIFGSKAYNIPISSIKSMIGQAMGAASAFQLAAACLALQHSIIPPTINLDVPDPECDLDYVPNDARVARLRRVLINAHAMGGTHSVLIVGSPPPP